MRLAAQYAVEFEFAFEHGSVPDIKHHQIEQIVAKTLHYLCDSGSLDPAAKGTQQVCVSLVKFQVQYNTLGHSHCGPLDSLERAPPRPLIAKSLKKKDK